MARVYISNKEMFVLQYKRKLKTKKRILNIIDNKETKLISPTKRDVN